MNDTAKCDGNGCPMRDSCYRFVRPAVDGQRWIVPTWQQVQNGFVMGWPVGEFYACTDRQPIPVDVHGGAPEEGDGA